MNLLSKKTITLKSILLFVSFFTFTSVSAQNDTLKGQNLFHKIKITGLAYGGTGVMFSSANQQMLVLTGGRGAATLNDRFTVGGGGWGTPKGIELEQNSTDTFPFFKFGYGGIELGYIFVKHPVINIGTNLLMGCGAGFQETYPKTKNKFTFFPVLQPTIYAQINVSKLLQLEIGLSYRYIFGAKFDMIETKQLNNLSLHIAFLVGTCNCN